MRIAIAGGGISGVTAAWQLTRLGHTEVVLYEASPRLGGTIETIRRDGFVIEGGPDGWVSEKPWARELALELGLRDELIGSNDAERVTYIVQRGKLVAMPDSMRMMVPTDLSALQGSPLFSEAARTAYAAESGRSEELKRTAPNADESVASFVRRHFGEEVLAKIGGPLLSGVFGGDVERLSVRAVMPRFVEMERLHGSLIAALTGKANAVGGQTIFTSLRSGTGTLIERMTAALPRTCVRLSTAVSAIHRVDGMWRISSLGDGGPDSKERFDHVLLALPAPVACRLLRPVSPHAARLMELQTSSAILCALAFDEELELPRGFGFLVPKGEASELLAGTFVDQKYAARAPGNCHLLRGYYGGEAASGLANSDDEHIAEATWKDLRALLGPLPKPKFSVVRRWPNSLPQYEVGHLGRVAELTTLIDALPGLHLLGNALHGVGLPDLIRHARALAAGLTPG